MPKSQIERIKLALDLLTLPECLVAYKPSVNKKIASYMFKYQQLKSKPTDIKVSCFTPLFASFDLCSNIEALIETIIRYPKKYMRSEIFKAAKIIYKLPARDYNKEVTRLNTIRNQVQFDEDFFPTYQILSAIYDRNTLYGLWPHTEAQLKFILRRYQEAIDQKDCVELQVVARQIYYLSEAVYIPSPNYRKDENLSSTLVVNIPR